VTKSRSGPARKRDIQEFFFTSSSHLPVWLITNVFCNPSNRYLCQYSRD
jgi:hypothetical protein